MKWANPIEFPRHIRQWLGQTPADPTLDAWSNLIAALRDSTQQSWNATRASYFGLKKVREDLGLPWMASPSGEANQNIGAWAPDLDQQAVDLEYMNKILIEVANQVLQNKRKLIWDPALKDFVIERLAGDPYRVELQNGQPVLVLNATNAVDHPPGTVGILPLLIGAGALAVVQGLAVYAVIKDVNATLRSIAEQKTMQTLSNNQVKMIEKGATPEQATAATKAVTDGAAAIKAQEVELEKAKGQSGGVGQWTEFIKVGGLIALGLGVLYLVAQIVPKGGVRGTARVPAMPMLENRRGRSRRRRRSARRRVHASGYGG